MSQLVALTVSKHKASPDVHSFNWPNSTSHATARVFDLAISKEWISDSSYASTNLLKQETKFAQHSYGNYVHMCKFLFVHDYHKKVVQTFLPFRQVQWSIDEDGDPFTIEYLHNV